MAASVATLSTSPETTDWLTGFIFMRQQEEDTNIKTRKRINLRYFNAVSPKTSINSKQKLPKHNNIIFRLVCSIVCDLQLLSIKNNFNITSISHRSPKLHVFFFCNIKNGLAENFTYIEKPWKININPINLCQQQWHLT